MGPLPGSRSSRYAWGVQDVSVACESRFCNLKDDGGSIGGKLAWRYAGSFGGVGGRLEYGCIVGSICE